MKNFLDVKQKQAKSLTVDPFFSMNKPGWNNNPEKTPLKNAVNFDEVAKRNE